MDKCQVNIVNLSSLQKTAQRISQMPAMCQTPHRLSLAFKRICRKLLQVLIHAPDPLPPTAGRQWNQAHFGKYPTLWHYSFPDAVTNDRFPSFIIGRNPCASPPTAVHC